MMECDIGDFAAHCNFDGIGSSNLRSSEIIMWWKYISVGKPLSETSAFNKKKIKFALYKKIYTKKINP